MAKVNPTNADLLKEFQEMRSELTLVTHDVSELKTWRIAVEAVEAYKRSEQNASSQKSESKLTADLVKQIGVALSIIAALVVAYIGLKGNGK